MMHKAWSIGSKVTLVADERMHNETVKNLWSRFSFTMSEADFQAGDPLTCRCGSTPLPVLQEGKEYALQADCQGFALVGALFILPFVLVYTAWSYYVFRGKVSPDDGYH